MDAVIVDSGVWYAMFDRRDGNHREAQAKAELLPMLTVAIPWPIAYETLRTRFVRNAVALGRFEQFLKSPNVEFVSDDEFKEAAFQLALDSSLRRSRPLRPLRPLSMVDCVIRLMLDDVNTRIRYLATFNVGDFIDVCAKNRVEII